MLIKALFVYYVIGSVLTLCVLSKHPVSVFDGMSWLEVVVSIVSSVWILPVVCMLELAKGFREGYQNHKKKS